MMGCREQGGPVDEVSAWYVFVIPGGVCVWGMGLIDGCRVGYCAVRR